MKPNAPAQKSAAVSKQPQQVSKAAARRLTEEDRKAGRKPSSAPRGYIDPRSKRPAVPHGLRSSFRDWVAERTGYPGEMAEVALAHKIPNAVEAAYRREDQLEKRREMMREWEAFVQADDPSGALPSHTLSQEH